MAKRNIFNDYLWEAEPNWDAYTVTYKPTAFTTLVYIVTAEPIRKFRIDNFIGNKLEIMAKIKEMAIAAENSRQKLYKYFVELPDGDTEGYESPVLHTVGDKVITDSGEYVKIIRIRNNGQPV